MHWLNYFDSTLMDALLMLFIRVYELCFLYAFVFVKSMYDVHFNDVFFSLTQHNVSSPLVVSTNQ